MSISKKVARFLSERIDAKRSILIVDIANDLNMSKRTLQRRLDDEGMTFLEIRDDVRYNKVMYMLKNKKLTNTKISDRLGFVNRNSFIKAFKRWTGFNPRDYKL